MQAHTKQKISLLLASLFLLIAVFSLLAWINNTCIAFEWTKLAFTHQLKGTNQVLNNNGSSAASDNTAAEVNNSELATKFEGHGPFGFFDRFAVDYSTVATFVVFFGSIFIMIGFWRIYSAEKNTKIRPPVHFPFFKTYNPFNVILGLIGTVWGLIMIGYYQKPGVEDLVKCLNTALYSTLIALIWVYFVSKPISLLMRSWYCSVSGATLSDTTGSAGLASMLRDLGLAVVDLAKHIRSITSDVGVAQQKAASTTESISSLGVQAAKTRDVLAGIHDPFKQQNESLDKAVASFSELCNKASGFIGTLSTVVAKLNTAIDGLNTAAGNFNNNFGRLSHEASAAKESSEQSRKEAREAAGRVSELAGEVARLKKAVDDARQQHDNKMKSIIRAIEEAAGGKGN